MTPDRDSDRTRDITGLCWTNQAIRALNRAEAMISRNDHGGNRPGWAGVTPSSTPCYRGRKPSSRTADLMIASTAIAAGLPLFTTNPDDFAGLADILAIVPVTPPQVSPER